MRRSRPGPVDPSRRGARGSQDRPLQRSEDIVDVETAPASVRHQCGVTGNAVRDIAGPPGNADGLERGGIGPDIERGPVGRRESLIVGRPPRRAEPYPPGLTPAAYRL